MQRQGSKPQTGKLVGQLITVALGGTEHQAGRWLETRKQGRHCSNLLIRRDFIEQLFNIRPGFLRLNPHIFRLGLEAFTDGTDRVWPGSRKQQCLAITWRLRKN